MKCFNNAMLTAFIGTHYKNKQATTTIDNGHSAPGYAPCLSQADLITPPAFHGRHDASCRDIRLACSKGADDRPSEIKKMDKRIDPKFVKDRSVKIQYINDFAKFSNQNRPNCQRSTSLCDKVKPAESCSINEAVSENWPKQIKDLGDLGPYNVESRFIQADIALTNRKVVGHFFTPHRDQLKHPAPLVVVIPPGFVGGVSTPLDSVFFDIQLYESYMKHMASYGFSVFGLYESKGAIFTPPEQIDHARDAAELSSLLDCLTDTDGPLDFPIDTDKIALMGHSRGAKLSYLAAVNDPRIGVVLAIDPVNQGGPPSFISKKAYENPVAPIPNHQTDTPLKSVKAACCLFRAPPDFINSEAQFNAEHFWPEFRSDGFYVDIDAKHADWLFDRELQNGTRAIFAAWLLRHFSDINHFDNYLTDNGARSLFSRLEVNAVDEKASEF